jgi:hypothetical protein
MKFKCHICEEETQTNDAVFELQVCISTLRQEGEGLGDYIHSPIYNKKICSLCAGSINMILRRGKNE